MAEADELFERGAAALHAGDHGGARDMMRRAGELGRLDAAVIYANFLASGTGGAREWQNGLAMLRALAKVNRRSARELALLAGMALTAEGDPVSVPPAEPVCEAPHIVAFRGLFSAAECRYLVEAAAPMLEPALIVDVKTGTQKRDPVRISDGCGFTWPLENPAVHALNRRIAAASGTAAEQGEPLQILRYAVGGEYKPHYDSIPGFANQRVLTMLVWLNEEYEGGETWFPEPKLALKGQAGDAVLFRNAGEDGRRDPLSAHAGLPVTAGEKLIASRWIRQRPFVGEMG
ncbi:MAG TPA: 2OG-Fe(II) oxygenase [Allosphingosinicella sp.]|nr:2OG-Fe(II) oxygenase [Allosphingosinicella sp.]